MLILLPPSETKRPGGRRSVLDVSRLSFPELAPQRESVIEALVSLAGDPDHAARVLKLSDRQRDDVADNAALRTAPTMPAVDRYTGVLYDALAASDLPRTARNWLRAHVVIHSAPFGPVGALDAIPSYRLAAGTSVPGLPSLRRVWADAVTAALATSAPRFVLDLRSEAYVALGPVPDGIPSVYLRVVAETSGSGTGGAVRALNHFNKHAKGALVRRLAESRPRVGSVSGLRRWADESGLDLRTGARGELDLVVGS